MRNFLLALLSVILCVVLCINFVRFVLNPSSTADEPSVVSVSSFLEALSGIGADSAPLLTDLNDILSMFMDLANRFTDLFGQSYNGSWFNILLTLTRGFFNYIASTINVIADCTATVLKSFYDIIKFLYSFFTSIVRFLNTVLGTQYSTKKKSIYIPKNGGGSSVIGRPGDLIMSSNLVLSLELLLV